MVDGIGAAPAYGRMLGISADFVQDLPATFTFLAGGLFDDNRDIGHIFEAVRVRRRVTDGKGQP